MIITRLLSLAAFARLAKLGELTARHALRPASARLRYAYRRRAALPVAPAGNLRGSDLSGSPRNRLRVTPHH